MNERFIPFDNIHNFRDFGRRATTAGGRLPAQRLYRSAHLGDATQADIERFASLDIALLLDLRRVEERQAKPSRRPAGFRGTVIERDDHSEIGAESATFSMITQPDISEAALRDMMTEIYRGFPFEEGLVSAYRGFLHRVTETPGPILIHCAAGKDRTGFFVALIQRLLGVHEDERLEDYLLTNEWARSPARIADFIAYLKKTYTINILENRLGIILGVEPAYLAASFAAIDAKFGSAEAYAEAVLGVTPAHREKLYRRLVE